MKNSEILKIGKIGAIVFICLLAFSIGAYTARARKEAENTSNPVRDYLRENYGVSSIEEYRAKLEQEAWLNYTKSVEPYWNNYPAPEIWKQELTTPRYGTSTPQLPQLQNQIYPWWINLGGTDSFVGLTVFSLSGLSLMSMLSIPKISKKLLKRERLVWLIIIAIAIGIAFFAGQTYAQSSSPNRYFEAYELPYSYMISTDGTYYYATRYDGYLAYGGSANRGGASGTNASAVIQSAINALGTTGGKIFIKAGTYVLTDTLVINKDGIIVEGEGYAPEESKATTLRLGNAINKDMIDITGGARKVKLSSLFLDGNKANQTDTSIKGIYSEALEAQDLRLIDVYIYRMKGYAIHITGSHASLINVITEFGDDYGIVIGGERNTLINCYSYGNNDGFLISGYHHTLFAPLCVNSNLNGIKLDGAIGSQLIAPKVISSNQRAIWLHNSTNNIVVGGVLYTVCRSVGNTYDAVSLDSASKWNKFVGLDIDTNLANKPRYGFYEDATAESNIYFLNHIANVGTSPFNLLGTEYICKYNIGFRTENSGTATNCINGTWISHGLAGTPTTVTLTISGSNYINSTCYLIQPTVIASNSTKFQIGFYLYNNGTITAVTTANQRNIMWTVEYKP